MIPDPEGVRDYKTRLAQLKNNYDDFKVEIEDNTIRLEGIKKITGQKPGLGGNLKYFKIAFADAKSTDANKKKLSDLSTEMLCLKEDCFEQIREYQIQ